MQRDGGPGGAGGAGNPTGGSFTGPAQQLEITGDFIYGISGNVATTNAETELLETTTGNFIIEGRAQFSYNANASDNFHYKIYFNDSEVFSYLAGHGSAEGSEYPDNVIPLIIPPYTKIKLTAENLSSGSAHNQMVMITGKIHRG